MWLFICSSKQFEDTYENSLWNPVPKNPGFSKILSRKSWDWKFLILLGPYGDSLCPQEKDGLFKTLMVWEEDIYEYRCTHTFVYDVMVTLSGWCKRKMVSRWQGSKSWAWPVSGTAPLHTWVFTSAHARVLGAFVYLGILAYLCCVHLHTFPMENFHTCIMYTGGTQHHRSVLRLCKYTSANSLDNNSQSERIPSEEGSRVQIGQNAMALEGGEGCLVLELSIWKILSSSFGPVSW